MISPYKPDGPYIHPRNLLAHMPCVTATPEQLKMILNGRNLQLPDLSEARFVKVFANQDILVSICERVAGPTFHPHTNLFNVGELPELLKAAAGQLSKLDLSREVNPGKGLKR